MYIQKNYLSKMNLIIPAHLLADDTVCIVPIYVALYLLADEIGLDWTRRQVSVEQLCKNATFYNNDALRARHYKTVMNAVMKLQQYGYIRMCDCPKDAKTMFTFDFADDVIARSKQHPQNGKNLFAPIMVFEYLFVWDALQRSKECECSKTTMLRIYLALRMYGEQWKYKHKDVGICTFVGYYNPVITLLGISRATMCAGIKELKKLGLITVTYAKHTVDENDRRKDLITTIAVFNVLCQNKKPEEVVEVAKLILDEEGNKNIWYKPNMTAASAKNARVENLRRMDTELDILPDEDESY